MQNTKTHDIFFSIDQPNHTLDTLLALLQEIRETISLKGTLLTPLHARTILLLDADNQRVRSIASLLSSTGYQPFIVTNTLEAFTLFLRGSFVPFAIVLGQHDPNTRFFLSRLLQQVMQKYRWNPPLIALHTQTRMLPSPKTDSLPPTQIPQTELSPILQRLPSSTSAPMTDALPFVPETPQQPFSYPQQTTQTSFPQHPVTPAGPPPTRITDIAPIINISTHDVQIDQNSAQKISLEGLSIGRYHMKTLLGSGPLGQVYQTYDRLREQDVAFKTIQMNALPPNIRTNVTDETNFFQQEIDLLSVLDHPHIVSPLNCGKSYISGSPFVYKTMPYYADGSLATLLYQQGTTKLLSSQEVALIVMQIADALQHAHAHAILYQNFKLSNLLLRSKAKGKGNIHIVLTDFSVTPDSPLRVKTSDMFPYIAPECWYGQAQPASDQYGLAAIAYELLTGRILFQGNSEQIMRQLHTTMQPQPLTLFSPHISLALSNVVLRALSKKPQERFPSVLHFAQALQQKSHSSHDKKR